MATRPRPQAVTHGDIFLSMILDELEEHGRVLADIRDRLRPATITVAGQPAPDEPVPVEIKEPEPAPKKRAPAKKANSGKADKSGE